MSINRAQWGTLTGTCIGALLVTSELCACLLVFASVLTAGPAQLVAYCAAIAGSGAFFLWFWRWAYKNECRSQLDKRDLLGK